MSNCDGLLYEGYLGNLTTLHALQHMCRFSNEEAAEFIGVSIETYRRWLTDRKPNKTAVKLLAVRAGYIPWAGWENWIMDNGYLFPPGYSRNGMSPGDIYAIPFNRQQIEALKERVEALELEIQALHQDKPRRILRTVM
jgi:transcriptional regulator with XRE-family HTH domain